jgi:hypothetical protein
MTHTTTHPTEPTTATAVPPASPPPESAPATALPPEPSVPFVPTMPAQLGKLKFEGADHTRIPWYSIPLTVDAADRQGFGIAVEAACNAAKKAGEELREEFLKGSEEVAGCRAAEARIKEHAADISAAEEDLKAATGQWEALFFRDVGSPVSKEQREWRAEKEAAVADAQKRLDTLKTALPACLNAAVAESKASAQTRLAGLLAAKAQVLKAAATERERVAKEKLAAAIVGPFCEWVAATMELDSAGVAFSMYQKMAWIK